MSDSDFDSVSGLAHRQLQLLEDLWTPPERKSNSWLQASIDNLSVEDAVYFGAKDRAGRERLLSSALCYGAFLARANTCPDEVAAIAKAGPPH